MKAPLLVELLTEELPPKSLSALSEAFGRLLLEHLERHQLTASTSAVTVFATPRRLAARITDVSATAAVRTVRDKILPVAIAFDGGAPTAPLTKKLASMGLSDLDLSTLERASDGKAEVLYLTREVKGSALADVMTPILAGVIEKLPIAKLMNYQINAGTREETTVKFARPAHGLVVLFGSELIDATVLGLRSRRSTLGHRFMSSGPIDIEDANAYEATLAQKGFVMPSFEARRSAIRSELNAKAGELKVIAPQALLDEVTALVEWPVVIAAVFDREFLEVPQECLILTMQQNQKYFALTDANGRMTERFLLVSNLMAADPTLIIEGNQRVLRARLADAKFFFEQDKKRSLESRLEALADVVYLKKLGTLGERVQRLEILARELAGASGADLGKVSRAARLAKADLSTDMVGEFPELQGTMGRYYALNDGEEAEVATAIAEHYRPRFSADALPSSAIGVCVAMADKLESLAGFFAINEIPSGERDPYALRRAALGVLRMLMDADVGLALTPWLTRAVGLFAARIDGPRDITSVTSELKTFMIERLRGLLREAGYQATEVEAVLSLGPERIDQVRAYLDAVRSFAVLPEAASLVSANKRIGNILRKNPADHCVLDASAYVEPAERELGAALKAVTPLANAAFDRADYTEMLRLLAALRDPVDRFFTDVMVMAEDPKLRANRLALLFQLHGLMNRFADLSMLAVQP